MPRFISVAGGLVWRTEVKAVRHVDAAGHPSTIRPLSDPANAPLDLAVQDDGMIVNNAGDGAGVEIAPSVDYA